MVLIGERYHQVDFSVRYADKAELLIAADSPEDEDADVRDTIDTSALPVRFIPHVELVAARMWIDNWHRMLPSIVATRGLISRSLLTGIERFANKPQQLVTIEREFSTGDPTVVLGVSVRLLRRSLLAGSEHRQCCENFRYCRSCSSLGYHSVLFQRPSESICPVHKLPLETECRLCGHETPYVINACILEAPFRCDFCRARYGGPFSISNPKPLRREVRIAIIRRSIARRVE